MKATALAPANIAFIKYWGKRDEVLRLPLNGSVSMNLSNAFSTTTVDFSPEYQQDQIELLGADFTAKEKLRVIQHLDRIRAIITSSWRAKVVTQNNFPKGTGIAASASGFAALTLAAAGALGVKLAEKELTILARRGSGSACRSIPDGFVEWVAGPLTGRSEDSYARSIFAADWWDLRDILLVVSDHEKKTATTAGMERVKTSPLLVARLRRVPARIVKIKQALAKRDLQLLGTISEEDCLEMHQVMQTQEPPLDYTSKATLKVLAAVKRWRQQGLAVYFTIDAGPNVHLICEGRDKQNVLQAVKKMKGIQSIIINKPAQGAHLIQEHLF